MFNKVEVKAMPISDAHGERLGKLHGEKAKVVKELGNVKDLSVLEIGFSDGAILDTLHQMGAKVYGLDNHQSTIKHLLKKPYAKNLRYGSFLDVPAVFPNVRFDAVILYSTLNKASAQNGLEAVDHLLGMVEDILLPCGILLICDGVEPENGDEEIVIKLSDEWLERSVLYMENHPFDYSYDLKSAEQGWRGTLKAATTMLYIISKGIERLDDPNEYSLTQILNEDGYMEMLGKYGFDIEMHCYFSFDCEHSLGDDVYFGSVEGDKIRWPHDGIMIKAIRD